jgi:hypothetical protein
MSVALSIATYQQSTNQIRLGVWLTNAHEPLVWRSGLRQLVPAHTKTSAPSPKGSLIIEQVVYLCCFGELKRLCLRPAHNNLCLIVRNNIKFGKRSVSRARSHLNESSNFAVRALSLQRIRVPLVQPLFISIHKVKYYKKTQEEHLLQCTIDEFAKPRPNTTS